MRTLLLFFLVLIARNDLLSCNCPPPYPNLKNGVKDTTKKYDSFLYNTSDVAGLVKIIDMEEVQIIIDTLEYKKMYKSEIKGKNIDPKYTSFEKYLKDQSPLWQMRKYRAVVIKDIKVINMGDTIYLYSDYSNCGMYFNQKEPYEIYGMKLIGSNYMKLNEVNSEVLKIPTKSYVVDICSVKYIKDGKDRE